MTEIEIAKLIFSYLPTLGVVLGVAKLYMKISKFIETIENQVTSNRKDIETLISIHIDHHDEDAKRFIHRYDKG